MTATTTRISDAFVPDVWDAWMAKDTVEKTAIFTSGLVAPNADLAAKLAGGGRTFNAPFWKDMSDDEPGLASDDPAVESTPERLTSGKDIVRRQVRTKSVSVARLTPLLTGGDPLGRLREASSRYWNRHYQRTLVKTLTGIFADNVANDSSDMVSDISTDSAAAITANELISSDAVMEAAQTMGDAKSALSIIIMHSDVQTRLAKEDQIDFIRDSEGRLLFETYLRLRVIVDDNVRKLTAGTDTTNRNKYYTYIAAAGAVAWAEVPTGVPSELKSEPAKGNGMGVDTIYMNRQYAMHVPGIKWTDASVAGEFPSYADLANASNWDRVYAERKQIPLALLITNG